VIAKLACQFKSRALGVGTPILLIAVLASGCETDSYPEDLVYPPRTDQLVVDKPKQDAQRFDRPGDFPRVLFPDLEESDRKKLLADPGKMNTELHGELNKLLVDLFGKPARPAVDFFFFREKDLKDLEKHGIPAPVVSKLKPLKDQIFTAEKAFLDAATKLLTEEEARLHQTELLARARVLPTLDRETLRLGSTIYRHQCLHCHGLSGDGRGATAPWVNPHPRDYRKGIFKFTSSKQEEGERKPRKEDLVRTITEGIEGTSMPSFRLLPDEQIGALASYVIHLSLRGETEFAEAMQSSAFGKEHS